MLILGEVYVDYTLPTERQDCKLRLGGIIHAARGLWANGIPYSAAIICPKYLVEGTTDYLEKHGCKDVILLGEINGSPNVISFGDVKEIGEQGYEDLLREAKSIQITANKEAFVDYKNILIFPGQYNLSTLLPLFDKEATFNLDIAYGVDNIEQLTPIEGQISALFLSTSSDLFLRLSRKNISPLISELQKLKPEALILKENRGGSRLFDFTNDDQHNIPAILNQTVNSVGVGDVYSAVSIGRKLENNSWLDAVWQGALSATYYSQTTFPDDFKTLVERSNRVSLEKHKALGGISLPWHIRPSYQIYLAAPDFSYVDRTHLEQAIASLEYHNFIVRRPVIENGELNEQSTDFERQKAFFDDCCLIDECALIFAIPQSKDPGTLVEIGLAIAKGKPVVTYDPYEENDNNMVIQGSSAYSKDLDDCLNQVFIELSNLEKRK
ncbi:TPA: nucleoside 2-deoxyribosyltransferase [Vibrio parahaemolyticus]|uniref:nucleoside 2-deoxyribosyltransferase n=1 Tax=Vibrio parahaemolyticus TaxID=670 RepID=UPI00146B5C72|nr:nucleoside 2-deoxyribosyltransferase [Vibrio parahaemolyticus]EJS4060300.1 nucleoside 2-deoxyribosyltransferase [Vibrio parahaemolyticus]EJV0276173.1 nucleoside 2-deoxyribosyltransferase [Vibrio parahaemolyticus]EKN4581094.1 nucleoside 2-deoxyribosyltransferase [Vibrio parahaemolyticus]MBE4192263.1 sugar kinase [Vibrio parahaemolyticus]MDF4693520.1 nucleoside 2-deoxyribosyltransferase [Vibrio parahaemolyticus]